MQQAQGFDVKTFEAATNALMQLLIEENDMLKSRSYERIGALQGEKQRLGQVYENQLKIVRGNPALSKEFKPEEKILLRSIALKFDAVAAENIQLLASAREVSFRVMECIKDAAMEQYTQTVGYGDIIASRSQPTHKKNGTAISVSLNETL